MSTFLGGGIHGFEYNQPLNQMAKCSNHYAVILKNEQHKPLNTSPRLGMLKDLDGCCVSESHWESGDGRWELNCSHWSSSGNNQIQNSRHLENFEVKQGSTSGEKQELNRDFWDQN